MNRILEEDVGIDESAIEGGCENETQLVQAVFAGSSSFLPTKSE